MNKRVGISLITLIITIVVLLILTGGIVLTLNNTGVVSSSKETKFKTDLKSYDEEIRLSIGSEYTHDSSVVKRIIFKESDIEKYCKGLADSDHMKYSYISEGVLTLRSKKVKEIYGEKKAKELIKWAKEAKIKIDDRDEIIISNSDIITKLSETDWTKNDVTLTIEGLKDKSIILHETPYSFDNGTTWVAENSKTYSKNTTGIFIKVRDEYDYIYTNPEIVIENIDKIPPTVPQEISVIEGLNTLIVMANGSADNESGMAGYKYSIDGYNWTDTVPENETYTFDKLHPSTSVKVYAKAVDKVGNESSNSKEIVTSTLEPNSNITITLSKDTWTKGPISATISCDNVPTNYVIQYKLSEDTQYTNGSIIQTINNNTTIYARLYYEEIGSKIAETEKPVTNIDNTAPSITNVTGDPSEWTKNDVTLVVNGATDNQSGLDTSAYSFDNGVTWQTSNQKTYESNISNIIIKVRDKVGNIYTHEKIDIAYIDKTPPSIESVSGNPDSWTKDDVTLTVNGATDNQSGLDSKAYSFDNGATWQTSNQKTYESNTSNIVIKVRDKIGNIYTHTAINITKIDKITPTITSVSNEILQDSNNSVALTINGASDNGGSGLHENAYSFDNGSTWQASNQKTFSTLNGSIIIKVRDNVENIYTHSEINISPNVSIQTGPVSQTVTAGNKTSFRVVANGSGKITYQWYYNTSNSTSGGTEISGEIYDTLNLTPSDSMNGRYYYCVVTSSIAGNIKSVPSNTALLTVTSANYSITNSENITYYTRLASAVGGAISNGGDTSGGTIKVLKNVTDETYATINKNITLNTDGKTITLASGYITITDTNTVFNLNGNGKITSSTQLYTIYNNEGNLNLANVTLENSYNTSVYCNSGIVTIDNCTITGNSQSIYVAESGFVVINSGNINNSVGASIISYGKVEINGGTLVTTAKNTVNSYGELIINDGNIICSAPYETETNTSYLAIRNYGKATINKGTFNSYYGMCINNDSSATLEIYGGSYSSSSFTIRNEGNVTINSGTFVSNEKYTLRNNAGGTVIINDGKFNSTASGTIYNLSKMTISNGTYQSKTTTLYTKGNATVNGGSFNSSKGTVVSNYDILNINGGTFQTSKSNTITNYSSLIINGGNIYNYAPKTSSGKYRACVSLGNNSNLTVNSGYFNSTQGIGIGSADSSQITITINNCEIYSYSNAINCNSDTSYIYVYIYGGTLTSSYNNAVSIQSTSSSVTIGSSSYAVNQSVPCCLGQKYGVYSVGSFYFYNGIIGGASSPYYGSISGNRNDSSFKYGSMYKNRSILFNHDILLICKIIRRYNFVS